MTPNRTSFLEKLMRGVVKVATSPALLVGVTVALLAVCGLTYAVLEHRDPAEGMWWALVTGFTVGYGDTYPTTLTGRVIGAFLMLAMFVLAACLAAMVTSRLIEDRDRFTHEEQEQIKQLLLQIQTQLNHTCTCRSDAEHANPQEEELGEEERQ